MFRLSGSRANPPKASIETVWLPGRGGAPIPSTPLIGEAPESGTATLAPWTLPALSLTGAQAVDFLAGCDAPTALGPGVLLGADTLFFAAALRYAGALVARQRYLPGVREQDGAWHAVWEPVFLGSDADRLSHLSAQMPPAARALADTPAGRTAPAARSLGNRTAPAVRALGEGMAPPETPAETILSAFLRDAVDALVRSAAPVSAPARRKKPFDSMHDEWLHALRTPDGAMAAPGAEIAALAESVRAWKSPIASIASAPFRLCFRLEEPEEGDGNGTAPWRLHYLVQPRDDPSLLVPLGSVWRSGKRTAALRQRGEPRAYVLAALGQAAGLSPAIAESLRAAQPSGCALDTAGAYAFLTETAGPLEAAGFGVLLPAWWTRREKAHVSVRAHAKSPKMQGGSGLTLDSLVTFEWQAALGDELLSDAEIAEFAALAEQKVPLVRLRGQWVEMDPGQIRAALDYFEKKRHGRASLRDLIEMALGAREAAPDVPVEGVVGEGWLKDLLERLEDHAGLAEEPAPAGFHGALRPYQARGMSWLDFLGRWGLGACLADDMGLGKTVQTLASLQAARESGEDRPALLVCPTSVVTNWEHEAARFTPDLPVMVHHGLGRKKEAAFQEEARRHALVVSSYALLHRDVAFLKDVSWSAVILDEAQNIKNPGTKQAQAARSLGAGRRIALTGTPVENNVGDLWSLMEFLNPGFLGTQASFRRRFFLPIQTNAEPEAAERLQRITGPFILRRLKTDPSIISDLPRKMEMKVFCNLTKEQASLYEAVLREMEDRMVGSEGIERRGLILGTLSRLKQVCNHPAHFLGDNSRLDARSGKLSRLVEMLEEVLSIDERALIFTQFAEMGALLQRHLQETFGREALFLHGGVSKAGRDRMVEAFQGEDGPPFFILSLKAGGTGLNLTHANHVFHFDRWWNPAVEDQATDRAYRIGQRRHVQVHKYVCAGTMEERIDAMIESKKEIAGRVVGAGEGWITELSNAELKDVFALRKDAVGD